MAKKVQMSGNVGQSRLNIFKLVNMILTLVLLGLGIVVLWTMYSQNFLNFRGINYILTIGVIAAIITVGLYLFPTSFWTTRTGLTPPCSEPTTGLKSA